ncbi:sensor histidine kinase [Clostridium chauvoei]|uniref:histidine kinase n=2 Tax=Clostridium chauvoei TaxID=46867 RepID=S6EQP1_9CLOT|nr:ATP-binding protein [Clostridium chauvoei]ATD54897.1 PAS domain-containing sensor histidine kinase [Clostridium chauvoei]ATD57424.1 PAS domain-containing sensor histidine kinase [Clostridium chauvoei]MBX7280489.1 HAMP domain-containing protein [Clostridium chauvoei]MBX7282974.1 HAMP domain-containing protein [Clostridium chauvoei]MBX7285491.1 HAMP domain-containing protein [Clostridium chauvoei]
MKRKIINSSIITVLFALIIVTCLFISLVNLKEIDKTKETLKNYNKIIINIDNYSKETLSNFKINNNNVRFTIIDKSGKVVFDSTNKSLKNHLNRQEIIKAFQDEEASSSRFSETEGTNVVYYATKISEDYVIRASVPTYAIRFFTFKYFNYYIVVIIFVTLLSLALSLKLIRAITYPLNELEIVTYKIANGDLNKRAIIYKEDEIGSLAHTFNNMADQLQSKINDSVDKQNKLEAILESMESGVIAIDNNLEVMLINPYAKRVFGINKEIIGAKIGEHIIDYDIINFIKEMPAIETREIKLLHPIEREIRIKKAPIISIKGTLIGIVIAVQDITDIKRLENMRSQFVANVSHELKTPLTSIKGFAETLKIVNDEETRNKFLDIINNEAERLTRLINDILVLSNIENNHISRNEEFDPVQVIENVINMVKTQCDEKMTKIEFVNNNKGMLVGDRDKFLQLILNLVENAIKYSENKSLVKINIHNKRNSTYITVEDNGIGIPKEDIPRIFERFYRVDKSRAKGGTGLGLAIVKHIAKTFNGDIYVDSTLGVGTKFTVKIKKQII